jgi:hypothetical protein
MPHCWACASFKRCLQGVIGTSIGVATVLLSGSALAVPLVETRAQLSDLERFPLFLPESQGTLMSASDRLSPVQISQPSLAWIQDQLGDRYGSDRLIEQWQAYRVSGPNGESLRYVDAIVNERIWSLLSDFERYGVILQFGTETKGYGYHLRVFHSGDAANVSDAMIAGNDGLIVLRGAYLCDFEQNDLKQNDLKQNNFEQNNFEQDVLNHPVSQGAACEVLFNGASRRASTNE